MEMTTSTAIDLVIPPQVSELVRLHGVEANLRSLCDLVSRCFPEMRSFELDVLEDLDSEDHSWIVLRVALLRTHSRELLREQRLHFYEEEVRLLHSGDSSVREESRIDFTLHIDFE